MELPTYTSIWRIEKRLYKLYDFRLPMPLPVGQILVFAGITVPYVLLLTVAGVPLSHSLFWLYVLPPGVLTWLATRPVLESKRLPELIVSQVRYLGEPRTWCRMAPLAEKDEVVLTGRVWRQGRVGAGGRAITPRTAQDLPGAQDQQGQQAGQGQQARQDQQGQQQPTAVADAPARQEAARGGRQAAARPAGRVPARVRERAGVTHAGARAVVAQRAPARPESASSRPGDHRGGESARLAPDTTPAVTPPAQVGGRMPAPAGPPRTPGDAAVPAQEGAAVPAPDGPAVPAPESAPEGPAVPAQEGAAVPAPGGAAVPSPESAPARRRPEVPAPATASPEVPPTAGTPAGVPPAGVPPVAGRPGPGAAAPAGSQPPADAPAPEPQGAAAHAPGRAAGPVRDESSPPERVRRRPAAQTPVVVVPAQPSAPHRPPAVERVLAGPSGRRSGAWRDHVVVVPGGRGPGRPDQDRRDRIRAELPLDGSRLVLVLGCTVGAGQSVTTLMLADVLARLRGDPVAALDLNPGPASLTQLAHTAPVPVGALLDAHRRGERSGHPRGSRDRGRPDVITADPVGGGTGWKLHDGDPDRLAAALACRYRVTLVDPGAAAVTRMLTVADQLVLVAPSSPDASQAVAMTWEWLGAHGHGALSARSILVLNGLSKRSLPHAEQAETVVRGRCRAIVRVPWDDHLAAPEGERAIGDSLAQTGEPSRLARLRPPVLEAYTALAGVLVASLVNAESGQVAQ